MQNPSGIDGAMSAFDLLCEQLDLAKSEFNERISEAAKAGNYEQVRELIEKAESLGLFKIKTDAISAEFKGTFGQSHVPRLLTRPSKSFTQTDAGGRVSLVLTNKRCRARATYDDGLLVLLRGSTVSPIECKSLIDKWRNLRQRLRNQSELNVEGPDATLVLGRDIEFNSPSGAACFVVGYSADGNRTWIVEKSGESLGDWLNSQRTTSASNSIP